LDFELQLPRSFLPEIVRLCKENGIQLILVRMKTLNFPVVETEPRALSEYISDLRAYLDQNDVVLLDFSHDVRLTSAHFLDAVHMNAEGRAVFTPMLADALRPYLP
jgi:lysophospholipase L1-like esterase